MRVEGWGLGVQGSGLGGSFLGFRHSGSGLCVADFSADMRVISLHTQPHVSSFGDSGFGLRVLGIGATSMLHLSTKGSGFGFRDLGFRIRVAGHLRVASHHAQPHAFEYRVLLFRCSGFEFRVPNFGLGTLGSQISGFELRG